MKILLLVRHGSAGADDLSMGDRSRPLDPRGEREVAWLAARCDEHLAQPGLIVTSPATRAAATARLLAEAFRLDDGRVRSDERLYEGWGGGLRGVLSDLDDEVARVAIVGHNPEVSAAARHFAPQIAHVPSGTLAALAFDISRWAELSPARLASACLHAPRPLTPPPPPRRGSTFLEKTLP